MLDLARGTVVEAIKAVFDVAGANVPKGAIGVVYEPSDFHERNTGPMVVWIDPIFIRGRRCNVYMGDVKVLYE